MPILDYLLLPMLFLVGMATSYEDIKYGKIRNIWIILGFGWAVAIYALFFARDLFLGSSVHLLFLAKSLLNGFIALFAGFLLWRAKKWAAGDAKLFFVFSLLLPVAYYRESYLPFFPSFALLINIFIPLLLFLFFRSCLHFLKFMRRDFGRIKPGDFFKKKENKKGDFKGKLEMIFGFLGIFLFFRLLQAQPREYFSLDILLPQAIIFSLIFMSVFALFNKLVNFYIDGEVEAGKRSFPMAFWIFFGALITLFLKGSALSLILRMVYPAPFP